MKHVVYKVYNPEGKCVRIFSDRTSAKQYIDKKNRNVPSWHYDELYKMQAAIMKHQYWGVKYSYANRRLAGTADIMPLGKLR